MKNSLWKLTALAGVVGIVLLAFLQAQQGLDTGDHDEFVPADLDEFANETPELGDPKAPGDAPPFDAIDEPRGYAAVGDDVGSAAGDEFDLGPASEFGRPASDPRPSAPVEDDPWATQGAERRESLEDLTPIRRRDSRIRTAGAEERSGGTSEPEILPVEGEELRPIPEVDDFGPDLFSDDPPETDARRDAPLRLPAPERFDGGFEEGFDDEFPPAPKRTAEFDSVPFDRGDEFDVDPPGSEDEGAKEQPASTPPAADFDDFPDFGDEFPADDAPQPSNDDGPSLDAPPRLAPFPPLDDEPQPKPFDDEPPALDTPPTKVDLDPLPFDDDPAPAATTDLGDPQPLPDAPERTLDDPREPLPLETIPLSDEPGDEPPRTLDPPADPAPAADPEPLGRDDLLGHATVDESTPVAPQKPRLTIEKLAPEHAVLGQPMVYSVIVKNVGDTPARQVVVHDRIPRGTELTGTIPRAELVEREVDNGVEKLLRWNIGTVEPGETKKIAVRVTPLSEGQVGSVATVNFVAEVAARTRISAPSLQFELSGPAKARLGKPVVFQFDLRNDGTSAATNVVIRDLVPAGLKHPGGDDLEYAVGDLGPGEEKSIRLSLTAAQEGEVVNRAVATADGGVKIESTSRVRIIGTDLAVSRTGPAKRYVGRAAQFTNVVANNGDVPLENVTVVETLPQGIEFVEAAGGGQYNAARREIAWRIDRLGPKESRVLKVKLLPKSPGRFECTITAKSDTGQEASAKAETQAVGYTALGLDVEGGGPPVFVGDTITFTVKPINRGTTNASSVVVDLLASPELELTSVNAPTKYTRSGNTVRFTAMPTLGGGASADYKLTFRAVKTGEGRIRTSVVADDLSSPLQQDAAVRIVAETP